MKDLGVLRYILCIEVASSPKGYLLSQSKYIANLFERARLTNNKIIDTPLNTSVRYSPSDDIPLADSTLYHGRIKNKMLHLDRLQKLSVAL